MNWKKIFLGGIVAGLIINVLDFIVAFLLTNKIYKNFETKGLLASEPRLPFIPLWILGMFVMGCLLAWFYAVARPRLGAGPRTALLVSFILALMVHCPYNFAEACWAPTGRLLPLIHMVAGIIEYVIAGFLQRGFIKKRKKKRTETKINFFSINFNYYFRKEQFNV